GEYRACSAQRAGHCGIGRCTPAASQNTFPERRVADCYQHNSAQNAVPGCGASRMRGKAISTTVRVDSKGDIGLQDVFGLASDATIIGGTQIVEVGGTAISTTVYVDSAIFQFGLLDIFGLASGATIIGGDQTIEVGGTANGTTLLSGGYEVVSSGGTDVA